MEPHARITRCFFEWERILFRIVGHNFIGEPFKPNPLTYLMYFIIVLAFIGQWYTIILYDMEAKIFAMISILLTLQVNIKLNTFLILIFHSLMLFFRFSEKSTTFNIQTKCCTS